MELTTKFNDIDAPLTSKDDAISYNNATFTAGHRYTNEVKDKKCLTLRPLTKLEAAKMATIPERQRNNRHQKQIVQHKEFHGPGFSLSPSIAYFKDFEVGKEYRQRIHLTNISYTFNEFKLEPLPSLLRTVLEVEYIPQSRMVAGKQCTIDVVFSPKENVDIDDYITISTKTGILQLPVRCQRKKCMISASSNVFDFGCVVVAEVSTQSVTIRNDGALSAKFTIEGDALKLFQVEHVMNKTSISHVAPNNRRTMDWDDTSCEEDNQTTMEEETVEDEATPIRIRSAGDYSAQLLTPSRPHSVQEHHNIVRHGINKGIQEAPSQCSFPANVVNNVGTNSNELQLEEEDIFIKRGLISPPLDPLRQSAPIDTNDVIYKKILSSKPDLSIPGKIVTVNLTPFSETTISIVFSPLMPCSFQSNLYLSFEDPDVDDIVLFIKGESIDVPVFISKNSVIDFECAFYETLYRDTFEILNTTSAAVKVTPQVPKALKKNGILEFVPKFGFVQPNCTFSFQVKFIPSPVVTNIFQKRVLPGITPTSRMGSGASMQGGSTSSFPFKVSVPVNASGQTMPMYVDILATLSRRSVRITEPSDGELRLGVMYTNERVEAVIQLTNEADMKRVCGFINIPSNIEVLDPFPSRMVSNGSNSNIIEMLPFETLNVRLAVRAGLGQFTQLLKVYTEHDDGCVLKVSGQGRSPPVLPSPSVINFPPCPFGMDVSAAVTLSNTTSVNQEYRFLLLRRHGVFVDPVEGIIAPGEELVVKVTFRATKDVVDLSVPAIDNVDEHEKLFEGLPLTVKDESKHVKIKTSKTRTGKKTPIEEEELTQATLEKEDRKRKMKELIRKREMEMLEVKKLIPWESSSDSNVMDEQVSVSDNDTLSHIPFPLHRTLLLPIRVNPAGRSVSSVSKLQETTDNASIRPLFLRIRCVVVKPTVSINVVHDPIPSHPIPIHQGALGATTTTGVTSIKKDPSLTLSRNSKETKKLDLSKFLRGDHPPIPPVHTSDTVPQKNSPTVVKTSLTPSTVLDFGCVPSEERVTRTLTIKNHFKSCKPIDGQKKQFDARESFSDYILVESCPIKDSIISQEDEIKQPVEFNNATDDHGVENTGMISECDNKKLLEPCMRLYLHPLDPNGVFRVSKPPLVLLRPQQSTEVCINFIPIHEFPYKEVLKITCEMVNSTVREWPIPGQPQRHTVTALLIGQGKLAELSISRLGTSWNSINSGVTNGIGESDTDGFKHASGVDVSSTEKEKTLVAFGTSTPFASLEQKYEFKNHSLFALKVRSGVFDAVNRNPDHSLPFMINPEFAMIQPKSSIIATVSFCPQAAGEYSASVRILYGGKSHHTLNLTGRCSSKPVFILAPSNKVVSSCSLISCEDDIECYSPAILAKRHALLTASPSNFLCDSIRLLPMCSTTPHGSSLRNPIVLTFNVSAKRSTVPVSHVSFSSAAVVQSANKRASSAQKGNHQGRISLQESVNAISPILNINATTAVHHVAVGMVKGYHYKAEFAVDGIDNNAIMNGWKVSLEGYTSCCDDEAVSVDGNQTASGKSDTKRDGPATISQMIQMAGQLSNTAFCGSIPSGSLASIKFSYTPTVTALNSIPINNVDIIDFVNVRILVKGGMGTVILPESDPAAFQRVAGSDAVLGQDGMVMYLRLKGVVSNCE